MPFYYKIKDKYFTASEQGSGVQRISKEDIIKRRGTVPAGTNVLDLVRKEGDIRDVDPSKIRFEAYDQGGRTGFNIFDPVGHLGIVENMAQAQALGITPPSQLPQGQIETNDAWSDYQKSQGSTGNGQTMAVMGDTGGQGGQVTRDANDNFFLDGKPIKLKADLKNTPGAYPVAWEDLGLNKDFVPRGSTVSFNQAKTGQVDGVTGGNGTSSSIDFNAPDWYKSAGLTDDMWNALDPSAQAFVESTYQLLQGQYDQGLANVSINSDLLNKALVSAATDPNIISKYGDALKLNQTGLQNTLALIDQDYAQSTGLRSAKQEAERKSLAEQQSEAGRAYSGFRQSAERQLATEQGAVIASSRRDLQSKLNQLGQGLEQTYGTSGLGQFSSIQAGGLAYQPAGGITGTEAGQKQADIEARQAQIFNRERLT